MVSSSLFFSEISKNVPHGAQSVTEMQPSEKVRGEPLTTHGHQKCDKEPQ